MSSVRIVPFAVITCLIFMQCGVNGFFGTHLITNSQTSKLNLANFTITKIINSAALTANILGNKSHFLHTEIKTVSAFILDHFGANITTLIEHASNHCLALVNKAASLGEAIAECAEERFSDYEMLHNDTIIELEQCLENKIEEGMNITNDLLNDKQRCLYLASNVTQRFINCTRMSGSSSSFLWFLSPNMIACKLRLAAEAARNFTVLEIDKAKHIHHAAKYLATFKLDLAACGILAATKAAEEAALIAADIGLCVANSTSTS